jgi:photosystem II stability/assembly factor-like uncharacterized protein
VLALLFILAAELTLTPQTSNVTARLRGISAVNSRVAWASGAQGTILRTQDGGATWQKLSIPNTTQLDFRDIDALDERTAYVLSIGPGDASRIYFTRDAGLTWERQFTNTNANAFYDAVTFANRRTGYAFSDSANGRFVALSTRDGRTWHPLAIPLAALPNEGAFAASGSILATQGSHLWIGTNAARVLHSPDRGRTWNAQSTGMDTSPTAGIFSLAFRNQREGIAVGGDFRQEGATGRNAALTRDGGRTWQLVNGLTGYRSAVQFIGRKSVLAAGPNGFDLSEDGGRTWRRVAEAGFDALSFPWAVGSGGRIARLGLR